MMRGSGSRKSTSPPKPQKNQRSEKFSEILKENGIEWNKYTDIPIADESSSPSAESSDEGSSESETELVSTTFLDEINFPPDDVRTSDQKSEGEWIIQRREKLQKLSKLYTSQFRRLYDLLKSQYRKFITSKEKAMKSENENVKKRKLHIDVEASNRRHHKILHRYNHDSQLHQPSVVNTEEVVAAKKGKGCAVEGCRASHMPLTTFCYAHILKDKEQKLFSNCKYVNSSGVACEYPILIGQNPPYCTGHVDLVIGRENKVVRKRKMDDGEGKKKTKSQKKEASNHPNGNSNSTTSSLHSVPSTSDPNVLRETIRKLKMQQAQQSDKPTVQSPNAQPISSSAAPQIIPFTSEIEKLPSQILFETKMEEESLNSEIVKIVP